MLIKHLNQSDMNLQATKMDLIKMITDINSEELIEKVKALIIQEKKDFWDDLSQEKKNEIDDAISDLNDSEEIDINGSVFGVALEVV